MTQQIKAAVCGLILCAAVGAGIGVSHVFRAGLAYAYTPPARLGPDMASAALQPWVDGDYIKVPSDIVRSKECLGQSTITLQREWDYGGLIGPAEDMITLGLYNTTLTPVGKNRVVMWFKRDPKLPAGSWTVDIKVQDDCRAFSGDTSINNPRERRAMIVLP